MLLLKVNKDLFLGIIFGITEVFGPDGSFAAPAGFCIVTNGLIWLFECKRLPTPSIVCGGKKLLFAEIQGVYTVCSEVESCHRNLTHTTLTFLVIVTVFLRFKIAIS